MSFRSVVLLTAIIIPFVSGCVGSLNRKETQIHFEAAQRFDNQGDYASARDHYGKALINARLAGADPATLSMLTYNYGRTSGYVCRFDEAEKHLLEALEMEKGITGPDSGISTMRQFELARFYFDQQQFDKSVAFFSQGIPAVEKLGISQTDPIGFADALDEYSNALLKIGKTMDATTMKQKASQFREMNAGKKQSFVPARYKCKQ